MKNRGWGRAGIWFALVFMVLFPASAFPRIKTLPLPELIGRSEIILIGRVVEIKVIAKPPGRSGSKDATVENVVVPERILKGRWPRGKPMSFITHERRLDGRPIWREDALTFPEKGSRVVLFVARNPGGDLGVVNGIQGLWPLGPDGKPLKMGSRYTVAELEREIARAGRK
ncbi:MAG: hypothetical protein WAW37_12235 [Syntrophobacteraceae bacterium]